MKKTSILNYIHFNTPTNEQTIVLKSMESFISAANHYDFIVLCGAAGTGKTSITAALIGYLNELDHPYKIAAPTARAARILGRKAKTTTSTIHSLIYSTKMDEETGKLKSKLKNGHNAVPTLYIIDEASMIGKAVNQEENLFEVERGLLFDLIAYIKGCNANNKILFLGDRYQLAPIHESESFALNQDFLEKQFNMKGLSFELTEVKRQEDGSYILDNATHIRKAIEKGAKSHPIAGNQNQNIYTAANKYVREYSNEGPENQIAIAASHKANKFFNDLVRTKIYGTAKKLIEPGDLLMVTQNWHRNTYSLNNGDHVQLIDVDWNLQDTVAGLHFVAVKIKPILEPDVEEIEDLAILEALITPGGIIDRNLENQLRRQRYIKNGLFRESENPSDDRYVGALRLTYGHAITCNKAQGGEWKKVYINTLGIPSLKWQYTAVTRGINEIEKF